MRPSVSRWLGAAIAAAALAGGALPASAEPTRGGNLYAATDVEPASLDPIFGNAPAVDGNIYNLIYQKLFVLDAKGALTPQLATEWTTADDQLSMTFKLRPGVTFHDGTPFNAAAVKFSIERAIDPALNAPHAQDIAAVTGVDVLDDMTVRINFKAPSGSTIAGLANEAGSIVAPAAVEASGDGFARNPVGTGPFQFVEWVGGDRIAVKAYAGYWDKDADGGALPYLDGVTVRFIPTSSVKILEAQSGNVQLIDTVQVKDFATIEKSDNLVLVDKPTGIFQWMAFNVTKPPFDDITLREAVLSAINVDALEQVVSHGYGVVTPTLVPPSDWVYDGDLKGTTYDVDRARALLAQTGFSDPITISVIQRDPDTQIAQIIQSMLGQAGFNVKVEILERQAWVDKVLARNHEIGLLRINVPRVDPALIFTSLMGRDAGFNFSGFADPRFLDVVDAADATLDRAKRRELYIEAQKILLAQMPYGFQFLRPVKDAASKTLNGLDRESSGTWVLDKVWLAN